jgi:hypothetical protein
MSSDCGINRELIWLYKVLLMFQGRSIMQRAFSRLRKIGLGLLAFFLLQYIVLSLPLYLESRWAINGALWPIVILIALLYALAAWLAMQQRWRA